MKAAIKLYFAAL